MKGKALRRALATKDVIRINAEKDVPLITDTTELVTPQMAQEILKENKNNRPVNWRKVEEYAVAMREGKWKLHAQGIIIDSKGNLLTGQKRLWAVVYADTPVYMRISRGNPPETARLIDRGQPQSARDLASRETERKHTPTEASIARAILVLNGINKPSADVLADTIVKYRKKIEEVLADTQGTKKTRSIVMLLAAICVEVKAPAWMNSIIKSLPVLDDVLQVALMPETAQRCWGRGAAFGLAMEQARKIIKDRMKPGDKLLAAHDGE